MDAESAARALLEARRTGRRIDGLPADARPAGDHESYAIQDAQLRTLGAVGGWKVGAKTPDSEPNCAALPASLIHASPQRFAPRQFPLQLVEAEIGFRLGRDLPAGAAPYAEPDLVHAIASVHATIEVLDSRFTDFRAVEPASALADFGTNGALVVGPGRTSDLRVQSTELRLTVYCDDRIALEKTGGNTAGDVFRLLVWLANHATRRRGGLRAGEIVTTGSCIGAYHIAPGTRFKAVFDGIPPVEATV